MLQVKIANGANYKELEDDINSVLENINSEDVKNIHYQLHELTAVIEFIKSESWKGQICSACKLWDDGGDSSVLIGECKCHKQRRRFQDSACKEFIER